MADVKVSGLTAATTVAITDDLYVNNGGTSKRTAPPLVVAASVGSNGIIQRTSANTLAVLEYATGTFTPVIADASSGGNVGSPSSATGFYTKIGNVVHVWGRLVNINTAGMTAGNSVFIRALPYTSNSTSTYRAQCAVNFENVAFSGFAYGGITTTASWITLTYATSGAAATGILVSALTSGTALIGFSATYQTD